MGEGGTRVPTFGNINIIFTVIMIDLVIFTTVAKHHDHH